MDAHRNPPKGENCLICFDKINEENYVEYKITENSSWFPAKFCADCLKELQRSQFYRYCDNLAKSDCTKEQRAMLKRGPPINLSDRNGFPEANESEIYALWCFSDKMIKSAKLEGSLVGEDRLKLIEYQKSFFIKNEENELEEVSSKESIERDDNKI